VRSTERGKKELPACRSEGSAAVLAALLAILRTALAPHCVSKARVHVLEPLVEEDILRSCSFFKTISGVEGAFI
jgi:hypothetical protein